MSSLQFAKSKFLNMDKSKFLNLALGIAKVLRTDVTDRAHVLVQLNRYNPLIKTYFPYKEYLEAYNPDNLAKIGDIVLIKKLDTARKLIETHQITEIVYSAGFVIDPMTGMRVDGERYIHDNASTEEEIRNLSETIRDIEHPLKLKPHRKLREFTHAERF